MSTGSPNPKSASRKNDMRWKTLVAYLPGMASVVNTFSSPEVQMEVYKLLISALEEKVESEDGTTLTRSKTIPKAKPESSTNEPMAVDIAEGESIHAMAFHP